MRKSIVCTFIVLHAILCPALAAKADDLPIDIDLVTRPDEYRGEAISERRGVDIFSETADETSEALELRHESSRANALESIFAENKDNQTANPAAETRNSAEALGLFAAPMQLSRRARQTEEDGFPLWTYIAIFAGAAGIGLLLAIHKASGKKERAGNVHFGHGQNGARNG